jgi:hypothetical protein
VPPPWACWACRQGVRHAAHHRAGRYLYGDLCTNRIRSFVWNGTAAVSEVELTTALRSDSTLASLVSFGEDLDGELYVADIVGTIYRIDGN